ncbi:MAG: hypothetical protein AMXMBFR12_01790 [Candidatus Babeliales bacterium]
MTLKKILFVTTLLGSFSCHPFSLSDFLRAQTPARKSALYKMGVGVAIATPTIIAIDSLPIAFIQRLGGLAGGGIAISGFYSLFIALTADEKNSLPSRTLKYDNFIHTVGTNKKFLIGAACAAGAIALQQASESPYPSDTTIACTLLGMGFMGWALGEQFNKDYMPHIIAFFNK